MEKNGALQENSVDSEEKERQEECDGFAKFMFINDPVFLRPYTQSKVPAVVINLFPEGSLADIDPFLNSSSLPLKRTFKDTDLFSDELLDPLSEVEAKRACLSEQNKKPSFFPRSGGSHADHPEEALLAILNQTAGQESYGADDLPASLSISKTRSGKMLLITNESGGQ